MRHIGHQHRGENGVNEMAMGLHHHRAGGDAMNHKCADEQGRDDIARDTQGDGWDQVRSDDGAVGRLGGGDALQGACAEFLRSLGGPLGCTVA